MAAQYPTILDIANSLDPDGNVAAVAEVLHQTNEIMTDIMFKEGNLPTGHRSSIRTGLPTGTWRRLYKGVEPTKSTRATVTDTCGTLEAYAKIDKDEADLNGNSDAFMLSEASAHIEGMGQDVATTLFYGDTSVNPERFDGFAPRFNSLSAANADNIIDAGGAGSDNRSIWLIVWGENTVHGIIPKASTAGINVTPKGQQTVLEDDDSTNSKMFEAYVTHFQIKAGLCLRDWRFVVRIANIDKSLLTADQTTGAKLPDLMFTALEIIPNMSGNAVFYMSRDVLTKFRQQLSNSTKNSTLEYENVGGIRTAMWNDVPLRRTDALAVDEARVT